MYYVIKLVTQKNAYVPNKNDHQAAKQLNM